jgi:hypothetical protein
MNTFITVTAIEWEVEGDELMNERSLVILNVDYIIAISAVNHDFENGLGIKTMISTTNRTYLVAESQEELIEKIYA